jgi:hypothetical protein
MSGHKWTDEQRKKFLATMRRRNYKRPVVKRPSIRRYRANGTFHFIRGDNLIVCKVLRVVKIGHLEQL